MIYKFKSKAAGDVIMLGPHGDQLLRLLGREPAAEGIIEVDAMAAMIAALQAAVAADEAARRNPEAAGDAADANAAGRGGDRSQRQRVWPMIEMMKRCHAARRVIVWGV